MQLMGHGYFWAGIAALATVFNIIYNMYQHHKDIADNDMEGKVDKIYCETTMKRLGKQVDDHEKQLEEGEKKFTKTEKCLIFLVEKQEVGAAAKMGLYD